MNLILRVRLVRALTTLTALAVLFPAHGQVTFTKTLAKVNGVPTGGSVSSLTNGDTLDWVLTYQYNPGPPPQHAEIRDVLPPTLQYVNGSLIVPTPSWTPQWLSGSNWVTTPPGSADGVGAFASPVPLGTGQAVALPSPPATTVTTTGQGDGYRAIPAPDGNLYMINHHSDTLPTAAYLDCIVVATGNTCTGYPAHVPVTAGAAFIHTSNNPPHTNLTPGKSYEYLDRTAMKLYYAVAVPRTGLPHDLGMLCADLVTKKSCGFVKLGDTTGKPSTVPVNQWFAGIGGVNGKAYMQLPNGKIGCLDTTTGLPCALLPYTAAPSTRSSGWQTSSEIVGTRIYSTWSTNPLNSGPFMLSCFDTINSSPCVGWGNKTPDPNALVGIIYPMLNAAGAVTGICAHSVSPLNNLATGLSCFDPLLGTPVSYPATFLTWVNDFGGGNFQAGGWGQTAHFGSRVFNGGSAAWGSSPSHLQSMGCYDFATLAPCAAWGPVSGPQVTLPHYATIADPERPGCMWYYGDDKRLGAFHASDGKPCSGRIRVELIVSPERAYCAGGSVTAWDKLLVNGLSLGLGVTASLSIFDGNNPTVPASSAGGTPYAQNLAITGFPVALGTSGLGIGYGTLPGQYKSLRIVLEFKGVTNSTPWTGNNPPNAQVTWIGNPPQFCFKTKVVGCEGSTVTNQATALTKLVNGSQLTSTAPNPPFSATHLTGGDCKASLTVNKNVTGAPAGFTGPFKFNVSCNTPNGPLQQQLTIVWPATSVTLSGIPAPSTCTVFEDPTLPPMPPGFSWSGLPVSNPANGVVNVTAAGPNVISFTNTARPCDDRAQIRIMKVVNGAPAGFSGTFTFNVSCWSASGGLTTSQAQVSIPGQPTVIVGGMTTGSTCTVTETGPLPLLPAGWFWQPPTYSPASGQVSTAGNCCPEIKVINVPKFCCPEVHPDDPARPGGPEIP